MLLFTSGQNPPKVFSLLKKLNNALLLVNFFLFLGEMLFSFNENNLF